MTRWALFSDGKLIVKSEGKRHSILKGEAAPLPIIGEVFKVGKDCYAATLSPDAKLDSESEIMDLRESFMHIPEDEYQMAGKGWELLFWDSHTRFCGDCGSRMKRHSAISKICSSCGKEIFPQLIPAVLVLVLKKDKALLVHARNFKRPFYGLVAGFVETGESLEECVVREVKEETSLEIKNIRYYGSQAWPYPANLMIGFVADYKSGNVQWADGELSDGGFFGLDNIPLLPSMPSLARQMIDSWINGELHPIR